VQYVEVKGNWPLREENVAGFYSEPDLQEQIDNITAFIRGMVWTRVIAEHIDEYWSEIRLPSLARINVYHTWRSYGGPEEGGWWYTEYEPQFSIPVTREVADSEMCRIIDLFTDRGSDHYNPDFVIRFEFHKPIHEPQQRPYYC
jgi:hypothetical protein